MSEPLAPDPCVFPPQLSAIPSVSSEPAYHDGYPTLLAFFCLLTFSLYYLKKEEERDQIFYVGVKCDPLSTLDRIIPPPLSVVTLVVL